MKYELLVFDMDGTILDTLTDITDAVNYAMRELSLPEHDASKVKNYVGSGAKELFKRALRANEINNGNTDIDSVYDENIAIDGQVVERGVQIFREYYNVHCRDKTAPYDGIMPLLRELSMKGYKLAVVSNKPDDAVKILVDKYFDNVFDFAVGEKEGVKPKPAPDMVNNCLNHFGISDRSKVVYIGDSDVDYNTSKNSELDAILVTWGFKDEDLLRTFNAKYYAKVPSDIAKFV